MATLVRYHNWARALVFSIAAILFLLMMCSCAMFEPQRVLADPQYVGGDVPSILTDEPVLDAAGQPTGRNYVIVSEDELPNQAPRIPIEDAPTKAPEETLSRIIGGLWGPWGIVALSALKFVVTPRGRATAGAAIGAAFRARPLEAAKHALVADGWIDRHPAPSAQPASSQAVTQAPVA